MTISIHDPMATVYSVTDQADPQTGNYTVSAGSNRLLLVWVMWEINNTTTPVTIASAPTWGGQTMTLVVANTTNALTTTTEHMSLYSLDEAGIAAASGTQLSVDFSADTTRDGVAIAVSLTGSAGALSVVDQNSGANHDVGSLTVSIATVESNNFLVGVCAGEASDLSPFTANQGTEVLDNANASANAGISYWGAHRSDGSGGSLALQCTASFTDKDMVMCVAEVEEASSGHTSTASLAFAGLTMVGTGSHDHEGTAAPAFDGLTLVGTGSHDHEGTAAPTFDILTMVGTGLQDHQGTAALAFDILAILGTGLQDHQGTAAPAFDGLTLVGTGIQDHQSTAALSIAALTMTGTGIQDHQSTAAMTVAAASLTATGTHGDGHTGTGAVTFNKLVLSAAGTLAALVYLTSPLVSNFVSPLVDKLPPTQSS